MNFIVYVSFMGLVYASSTPSTPKVPNASTQQLPTTKISSMAAAGVTNEINTASPLSTTSDKSKNTYISVTVGNDNGILGILGTNGAVNLEESAMTDTTIRELSSTKQVSDGEPVKAVQKTGTDPSNSGSSDNMVINSVNDKNSAGTDTSRDLLKTDQSAKDVKIDEYSLSVNKVTDGNSMELVNVGPETALGNNVPKSTAEVNMVFENSGKLSPDTHIQKNDPMQKEPVKISKVLVTGDINLDAIKASEGKNCNVKNGKCVPTREELIASGVTNVDFLQHKVDFKPANLIANEPSPNNAAETNVNEAGEKKGCNVKNSTCVPTREELIASGATNVDFVQHKVDFKPSNFISNEPSTSSAAETNVNKAGEKKGCNVKNSTCVPTREELIASGATNVDFVQHKVDFKPPNLIANEPSPSNAAETNVNEAGEKKGCNVKNSTCVPTREELIASGATNVDFVQHKVYFKPPNLIANEPSPSNAAETNVNEAGEKKGCNVKNSTCVPTREELIASGATNVDFVQHKVDFKPPSFASNEPSPSNAILNEQPPSKIEETNAYKPGPKCNVKNSTCVPSEKELIASGADMSVPRQYKIDTENAFLGQLKQMESEAVDGNIGLTSNKVDSASTSTQVTGNDLTLGSGNTNIKSLQKASEKDNRMHFKESTRDLTKAMKPTTVQQIPEPGQTTLKTKSIKPTAESKTVKTSTEISSNLMAPKKENSGREKLATSAIVSGMTSAPKTTLMTTEFQTCPTINCQETCIYNRKINSNGCETCECKFSNSCPRVITASRLLCMLRAKTSQSCESNADCRRNRICCPGMCEPICRRASRNRSRLLSMLVD